MSFTVQQAQVTPYLPVRDKLFKKAFLKNYRRARSLQRESVRWFTSSRNYRFLTAIGAAAFVVLGAAICQIKASDYSALFIHRSGANFIWSIITLLFCTVEFCRMYRKKEGLWSWEVGSAAWLGVTVVVTDLAIANNIAGTMDLAPKIYTAKQTTPYPFYYGQTTVRFPETTTIDHFALFPKSKNSQILNEWNTWQWSVWRKAIFILYCFCTVVEGLVMIFCYLPYIFFKVHEFRLGYGRRLLSSKQVHDVTVNAVQAYNAAVYNRKKLKEALEHGNTPQPVDVEPVSEEVSSEKAETEVSTISQNRFKRACDLVKPGKQAILPLFVDESESGFYPSEVYSKPYGSSYGSYYTSYYTNYTKPTTETIRSNKRKRSTTPKSDSYYTYYDGYSSYSSNSSKSRRSSSKKTTTTAYSDSYSDYSGPTIVTRNPGGRKSRDDTSSYTYYTSYYEDEDADTFTEYIPAASFRRSPTQYTYASTTSKSDNHDSYNQLDDRNRRYYTTATYTGSATGTSSGTTTQSSSYSSSTSSTQTATTSSDGYSTVENSITEVGTTASSHSQRTRHPHRRR